jgi:hypothetical protein
MMKICTAREYDKVICDILDISNVNINTIEDNITNMRSEFPHNKNISVIFNSIILHTVFNSKKNEKMMTKILIQSLLRRMSVLRSVRIR